MGNFLIQQLLDCGRSRSSISWPVLWFVSGSLLWIHSLGALSSASAKIFFSLKKVNISIKLKSLCNPSCSESLLSSLWLTSSSNQDNHYAEFGIYHTMHLHFLTYIYIFLLYSIYTILVNINLLICEWHILQVFYSFIHLTLCSRDSLILIHVSLVH